MYDEFLEKANPYFTKQCKNRLKIDNYTSENWSVSKNFICMVGIHPWDVPGVSSDALVPRRRSLEPGVSMQRFLHTFLTFFCFLSTNNFWGCCSKKPTSKLKIPSYSLRKPNAELLGLLSGSTKFGEWACFFSLIFDFLSTFPHGGCDKKSSHIRNGEIHFLWNHTSRNFLDLWESQLWRPSKVSSSDMW